MDKLDKIFSQILGWIFIGSSFASIWFPNIRLKLLMTAIMSLISAILFSHEEKKKED